MENNPLRPVHTERHCHVNVTVNVKKRYVDGQMGMQPILPVTVPVKKIKGADRQHYIDGDVNTQCEQTFKPWMGYGLWRAFQPPAVRIRWLCE